jgi:hypothetical protein
MNISASRKVSLAFSGLFFVLLVLAVSATTAATAGTGSVTGGGGASVERPRRSVPKITAKVSKPDLDVFVWLQRVEYKVAYELHVSDMVTVKLTLRHHPARHALTPNGQQPAPVTVTAILACDLIECVFALYHAACGC